MLYALKELTLDAWDWILGRKYPRQELLESLHERPRQFPAPPDLKECQSKIGANLKAQTKLTQSEIDANLKAETALVHITLPPPLKLVRQPRLRLHGMWEREAEKWINTHPEESVTIIRHTLSHEEF